MTEAKRCAICGKPQEARYRPFCSKRCADVDLGRWFTGHYAIPASERVPDTLDDETVDAGKEDHKQ